MVTIRCAIIISFWFSLLVKGFQYRSSRPKRQQGRSAINPTWKDIVEVPISVHTREDFDSLLRGKRIAIVSRVSVLHLTLLSTLGPLVLRGSVRSSLPRIAQQSTTLTPWVAILFAINCLSWHAFHNLLNDFQDLEDDDKLDDSFRLAYGCHALRQGFLSKPQFLRLMLAVATPGILLTLYFMDQPVAAAGPLGLASLFLYTILFKPIALGEVLIYLTWGPLMAGFGTIASGASNQGTKWFLTDPVVAQFGLMALCMIMGKHTDKIDRSNKTTLPKVLGYPAALWACATTIILPHILLVVTLVKERLVNPVPIPTLPLGASLALLALFREVPACLKVFSKGRLRNNTPNLPKGTMLKGTLVNADLDRTWPLWFVAVCGWHCITFGYLMVVGSGLEWILRAIWSRLYY